MTGTWNSEYRIEQLQNKNEYICSRAYRIIFPIIGKFISVRRENIELQIKYNGHIYSYWLKGVITQNIKHILVFEM